MKTALLIVGLPTDEYAYCYMHNYHTLIKHLNPDIYIYTTCNEEDALLIEALYRPKKAVYQKSESKIDINIGKNPLNINRNILHLYKKLYNLCFLVKQKYDWMIKTRFDCFISNIITKPFLKELDKKSYYIPILGDFLGGLHDLFCLASQDNMYDYCHLYYYIEKYIKEGCTFHPELLLRRHLKNKKIIRLKCETYLRKISNGKAINIEHGK